MGFIGFNSIIITKQTNEILYIFNLKDLYNIWFFLSYLVLTKKCIIEMYKLETENILNAPKYIRTNFNRNHFDINVSHYDTGEHNCYVYVKCIV